jgi:hypothetical protein
MGVELQLQPGVLIDARAAETLRIEVATVPGAIALAPILSELQNDMVRVAGRVRRFAIRPVSV